MRDSVERFSTYNWKVLKDYYESKKEYMQGQIRNPECDDKPNKKYYDPRIRGGLVTPTLYSRKKGG